MFFMSATGESRKRRYSVGSGSGHTFSSARAAALRTWPIQSSSLPITPAMRLPNAATTAPVSVARSTMASTFSSTASESPSARTSRPSASVFSTSTVLPLRIVITSPGLSAVPLGMLSVQQRNPTTFTFGFVVLSTLIVASTAAAPRHVDLHRHHPLARLQRQPAGVEHDPLADQRHRSRSGCEASTSS